MVKNIATIMLSIWSYLTILSYMIAIHYCENCKYSDNVQNIFTIWLNNIVIIYVINIFQIDSIVNNIITLSFIKFDNVVDNIVTILSFCQICVGHIVSSQATAGFVWLARFIKFIIQSRLKGWINFFGTKLGGAKTIFYQN